MFTPDVKVIKRAIDSLIDVRAAAFCFCACDLWGGSGLPVLVLVEQVYTQQQGAAGQQAANCPTAALHPATASPRFPFPTLAQRDYLERDAADPQLYKYLA